MSRWCATLRRKRQLGAGGAWPARARWLCHWMCVEKDQSATKLALEPGCCFGVPNGRAAGPVETTGMLFL